MSTFEYRGQTFQLRSHDGVDTRQIRVAMHNCAVSNVKQYRLTRQRKHAAMNFVKRVMHVVGGTTKLDDLKESRFKAVRDCLNEITAWHNRESTKFDGGSEMRALFTKFREVHGVSMFVAALNALTGNEFDEQSQAFSIAGRNYPTVITGLKYALAVMPPPRHPPKVEGLVTVTVELKPNPAISDAKKSMRAALRLLSKKHGHKRANALLAEYGFNSESEVDDGSAEVIAERAEAAAAAVADDVVDDDADIESETAESE